MSLILNLPLLLTVFLTPLLSQIGEFGWEQVKVLFFIIASSLAGSIYLWDKSNLTNLTNWSGIKILALIFLLTLGITSFLGLDQTSSFLGRPPYYQGFILYSFLFLFFLMVSSMPVKIEKWALALVSSSVIVSVLAIEDFILMSVFHISFPTYAGRVVSTFGQPNFYAGFLLLTLPFSYCLIVIARNKATKQSPADNDKLLWMLGWGSGLLSVLGILVSCSRSAILLALMLLVLGLTDQLKNKIKIGLVVLAAVFASIIIAWTASSGLVGNEISRPIKTFNPDLTRESIEKRAYIWPVAFKIAIQKPLKGYGLENIENAFADYFQKNKHPLFEENLQISPVLISLKELVIDRSHNYPLDLLLFGGAASLGVWVLIVALLFWKLKQTSDGRHKNVLVISLVIYLVWIQFQNQSVVHLIYFWLLAGLIDGK